MQTTPLTHFGTAFPQQKDRSPVQEYEIATDSPSPPQQLSKKKTIPFSLRGEHLFTIFDKTAKIQCLEISLLFSQIAETLFFAEFLKIQRVRHPNINRLKSEDSSYHLAEVLQISLFFE